MEIEELVTLCDKLYRYKKSDYLEKLNFHIDLMNNGIKKGWIHQNEANSLTEIEILTIVMMECNASDMIQQPAFVHCKSNKFTDTLIEKFDSALGKSQKCTHQILYRNEKEIINSFCENQIVVFSGYFTTSKDDFDNALTIKWIIKPLSTEMTKAREIYRIYNHGHECPYPEYQVEFERGTVFLIRQIKRGEKYDTIYIDEVE